MKTITKPVYYCDYCKKKGLSKFAMELHEERCFHNPENFRLCFGCANLIKKDITLYFDTFNGEGTRVVQSFFVSPKKSVCIHLKMK